MSPIEELRAAAGTLRTMRVYGDLDLPLANWLEFESNIKHRYGHSSYRGILGGYALHCSCGADGIQPDPSEPVPPCDRMAKALAAARAINGGES